MVVGPVWPPGEALWRNRDIPRAAELGRSRDDARVIPRRTLVVLAVVAAASIGLAVLAVLPRGGGAEDSGVDWTVPVALPPPVASPSPVPVARGVRYEALSGRVVASQAYRYATGPCGLSSPIDFDGSLWDLADPPAGPDPLLGHADAGAIALVDFDRAVYRSSHGAEYPLVRRAAASVVLSDRCA